MMLRITLAQLNFTVGNIEKNQQKIIDAILKAKLEEKAHLIIFPELAITGYPLEDLLHRSHLYEQAEKALNEIAEAAKGIDVLIGYPERTREGNFNTAAFIRDGKVTTKYHKQTLPNYSVFDEHRYFTPDKHPCVIDIQGIPCGILICEDIWVKDPIQTAKAAGAELILCLNASPYSMHKANVRLQTIQRRVKEAELPVVFVNLIGGQDELVFDGGSMVLNSEAELTAQAPYFEESLLTVEIENGQPIPQYLPEPIPRLAAVYQAVVLGVRDYIEKNHFPGVIIGLSGGIDSALTLAIAADAIGPENVTGILMPSQYTAKMSIEDAEAEAKELGVKHYTIPIKNIYKSFMKKLKPLFKGSKPGLMEENLQARIRGTLLMSISNKTGNMVLTTGNKSELAVGYSTLYGDMAGGFCVLKDILKTLVYQLSEYRNSVFQVIPRRVIDRPPSAELKPDQTDQDSLPPYDILDHILKQFIEKDKSITEIAQEGLDEEIVRQIVTLVQRNEYKRRQAPPGVRITEKAFGRDRRYPITSGYKA